jgi:hypothetical protein
VPFKIFLRTSPKTIAAHSQSQDSVEPQDLPQSGRVAEQFKKKWRKEEGDQHQGEQADDVVEQQNHGDFRAASFILACGVVKLGKIAAGGSR